MASDMSAAMLQRNQEIGRILEQARRARRCTVTECAQVLQTSRRHYYGLESGELMISAVELEALIQYLAIPRSVVWPDAEAAVPLRQIELHPGEAIQFVYSSSI